MKQKFTKIVATISDKRCDVDFIQQLFDEGMNVVRLNSAHLDRGGFMTIIQNVRQVSNQIGLLVDTKGPEVRTTKAENDKIILKTGEKISIKGDINHISTRECIGVSYPHFVRDLHIGDDILIDDGEIDLKVIEKTEDRLICEIQNDGVLGSRKSVNVPGVRINLPSLTERDKNFIQLSIEQDIDFIAHSFVRSRQDVLDIKKILDSKKSHIKIVAKIENQEGVDKIDEILEVADGVMIARGDLGIEVAQEKIPGIQRKLIRKCVRARKPVIVATQMLHSMIENPRPTRAEVTDIANAIYYRTDSLMLSGETAYGKYPVEAVRTMSKIALEAELTKISDNDIPIQFEDGDVSSFLAHSAVQAGKHINIKAIFTDTFSGRTARFLSSYRTSDPILAVCYVEYAVRQLSLSYGVFPYYQENKNYDLREFFSKAIEHLLKKGELELDDIICYMSGPISGTYGTTFMEINTVKAMISEIKNYIVP